MLAAMVVVTGFVGAEDFPAYLEMAGTTIIDCDKASVPTDLVIPNGVKIIDVSAFRNCERLTSVTIPSSVMFIGHFAFENCHMLTSVTIQEGVRGIGKGAFENCTDLVNVTIPKSVIKIWSCAFVDAYLTTVRYNGTKAEWKRINKDTDSFEDTTIVRCTDGEIMWWE